MRSSAVLTLAALIAIPGLTLSAQKSTQGPDDPTIVAIFDAANAIDVETGNLAIQRSSTESVRNFARMMVTDHSNVRKLGQDLAHKLGVTPTPPSDDAMARDHRAVMQRLRGLSGAAFDRAYVEQEIAFHKAVIEAVTTTLLPAIDNAELKALVEKVAPAFVAHQKAAENLLATLK